MSQTFEVTSLFSKAGLTRGKTYIVQRVSFGPKKAEYYHIVDDEGSKAKFRSVLFMKMADLENRSL